MQSFINAAREFARDEEGVTAIEYGLIAAVIARVVVGVFMTLGDTIKAAFTGVSAAITKALSTASGTGTGGA
jgi:pilus assembly protein Flp/PilA